MEPLLLAPPLCFRIMFIYTSIPKDASVVVVADFFVEDLIGGAELTTEAILKKCPQKYCKVHSAAVTPSLVEANKDKHWILGNFAQLSRDSLISIAVDTKFSVIECDYKYCLYRSSHLHKLQTGNDCDCNKQDQGRFIQGLFKRAHKVHFMSQGQLDEYKRLFPKMKEWPEGKLRVQGSTFSDEDLEKLGELHDKKKIGAITKGLPLHRSTEELRSKQWSYLTGASWIKNQEEIVSYCDKKRLNHRPLKSGQSRENFLVDLAMSKGLVFHPKGFDTNPRITIEAKLLGLDLDLNENVQQKDEPWFTGSREECLEHLKNLADNFWKAEGYDRRSEISIKQ